MSRPCLVYVCHHFFIPAAPHCGTRIFFTCRFNANLTPSLSFFFTLCSAFGSVYKATHVPTEGTVAIKQLPVESTDCEVSRKHRARPGYNTCSSKIPKNKLGFFFECPSYFLPSVVFHTGTHLPLPYDTFARHCDVLVNRPLCYPARQRVKVVLHEWPKVLRPL